MNNERNDKLKRSSIPEARYRCDGIEFGAEILEEIHFREDDGGYRSNYDLYLDTLYDKETESDYRGYISSIVEGFNELDLTRVPYEDREGLLASIRGLYGMIWDLVDFVEKIDEESIKRKEIE